MPKAKTILIILAILAVIFIIGGGGPAVADIIQGILSLIKQVATAIFSFFRALFGGGSNAVG